MDAIIEARSLSLVVDDRFLLDRFDIEVNKGESYGFIGPKSAGKTVALKVISAQSLSTSGELFVMGQNARSNPSQIRRIVGVVPQNHGFEMDTSVMESLVYHGILYGLSRGQAKMMGRDLLRQVQLDETEMWPIFDLSPGQLLRLSLARARINQPQIVIVDNDLQGLGNLEKEKFWSLIETLKSSGLTILISSRDLENVERLCDRVVLLEGGKIVCQGEPDQLIESHIGRSVVEYKIKPNELEYHLQAVDGRFQFQLIKDRLKIFVNDPATSMNDFRWVPSEKIVYRKAELKDLVGKLIGHDMRDRSL